ncbi:MAG: hypothetical protein ACSNEK_07155 [Parachlamydiaceae bacterium]
MEALDKIREFGKSLLAEIEEGMTSVEVGRWIFLHIDDFCDLPRIEEESKEVYEITIDLMVMAEEGEHAYSSQELQVLANSLIFYRSQEACKVSVGWELEELIRENNSVGTISNWADALRDNNKLDPELDLVLEDLSLMIEVDDGFEYTVEELRLLALLLKLDVKHPYEQWRVSVEERWKLRTE